MLRQDCFIDISSYFTLVWLRGVARLSMYFFCYLSSVPGRIWGDSCPCKIYFSFINA